MLDFLVVDILFPILALYMNFFVGVCYLLIGLGLRCKFDLDDSVLSLYATSFLSQSAQFLSRERLKQKRTYSPKLEITHFCLIT